MEHISILHHTNASSSQSKLQHAQNARAWKGAHSTPQGKLTPPLQKSTMMSPGRASSRTAVTRFSSCWHLRSTRLAGTSPDDTETQHYHDCSIFQLPPPACLSDTLADTVTKALLSLWFSAVDAVCVSLFVWYLSCWQAVTAIFRFFSCSHAQLGWYLFCHGGVSLTTKFSRPQPSHYINKGQGMGRGTVLDPATLSEAALLWKSQHSNISAELFQLFYLTGRQAPLLVSVTTVRG